MRVVQSVDKGDLELLLNIIVRDAAKIGNVLRSHAQDASDQDMVEFMSKQMESRANLIANIASQALYAWDMEEFDPRYNDDYDNIMKEAGKKVGHFEKIEWQG